MKFLVDAQLPRSLSEFLNDKGHDAVHTLDLPEKNITSDSIINKISIQEKRIVISKDSDFYNSFFQKLEPHKLLFLTTGNIPNKELLLLFEKNLDLIISQLEIYSVIELSRSSIIVID